MEALRAYNFFFRWSGRRKMFQPELKAPLEFRYFLEFTSVKSATFVFIARETPEAIRSKNKISFLRYFTSPNGGGGGKG